MAVAPAGADRLRRVGRSPNGSQRTVGLYQVGHNPARWKPIGHPGSYGGFMTTDEPLDVEVGVSGDTVSVRVDGEIDTTTAHVIDDIAMAAWAGPTAPDGLVLDLRDVTFCDASGLEVLIRIWGDASARGIPCQVLPSRSVRRVVQAAQADHILPDGAW